MYDSALSALAPGFKLLTQEPVARSAWVLHDVGAGATVLLIADQGRNVHCATLVMPTVSCTAAPAAAECRQHPLRRLGWPARLVRTAAVAGAAALPWAASAELSNDSLLGLAARSRPAYEGSATQRLEPVPVIRYFGQPGFVRSTQGVLEGGARVELLPGLHAGAQLAYEPGRQGRESDFLTAHRVPDIDRGVSVGLHLEWDHQFGPMPVTLLARVRKNTRAALGLQADLRLSAGAFQSGPFGAGVFVQAIWADAKAADSYFGVGPPSSGVTGLPAFKAASGWVDASFGVLWSFDLSPSWMLLGSLESRRLHGDAARSPLTQRSSNSYLSAGLAYHF